ncbi:glycosyltransferase [Neobacillus sp. FSL H8-0543]|uniref:glycosyltransferase n=1 Tax=Neobacillus sp. FSL H8-0543 TaxID=2954672 RepID=UPI0031594A7F
MNDEKGTICFSKYLTKMVLLFLSFALIFPAFTKVEANETVVTQNAHLSEKAVQFKWDMRKLWLDHSLWTGRYVVSALAGLEDQEKVLARLLKTMDDTGNLIKPYYGEEAGNKLGQLLREHILLAGKVVAAAKSGNQADLKKFNKEWYKNADDITDFLAKANPNYNKNELREALHMHLKMITDTVVARLKKDWDADILAFDKNEDHLIKLADTLSEGIIKQFPNNF